MPKATERFKTVTIEFFDFIIGLVEDLNETNITSYDTIKLDYIKMFISNYPSETLLESFLHYEEYWTNIGQKDKTFIEDDLPVIYKDLDVDVNIIISPYREYNKYLTLSEENKKLVDMLITSEDIDNMWNYFSSMVSISCNYIHNTRKPNDEGKYTEKFYEHIDLDKYVKLFSIKLLVDK